jgi:FkbM family methyltransferase
MAEMFEWLARTRTFKTLIDIGANGGAFGAFLQKKFAIETVHAIEPLSKHGAGLRNRGFIVHGYALADYERAEDLLITEADSASSLLMPSALCKREYPRVRLIDSETVHVRPLDTLSLHPLPEPILVKIDAQGCEAAILRGGRETLSKAAAVYIEQSFVPLYEGGSLFGEVHAELADLGFALRGFRNQLEAANGEPLFAHCIYLRPNP